MTYVNKLYTEFAAEINEIFEKCKKSVSEADNIEQDLLHFLENESCDAVTMVMIAKKLQENRRERRKSKILLEQIQSIKSNPMPPNRKDLTIFENKTYKYRSNIIATVRCKHKGE